MKTTSKVKPRRAAKRNLFAELSEGMTGLAEARRGKRTLRTQAGEYRPAPKVTPKELIRVREELKISRALFAVYFAPKFAPWRTGSKAARSQPRKPRCSSI